MTSSGNLIFHGWGKFTYRFFLKGFVCIIRDERRLCFFWPDTGHPAGYLVKQSGIRIL